jgi:long-chain fatty acid transport protein
MQSITLTKSRVAHAVAALVLAWGSGQAFAAGFALQENSGSGLGNAYAGGAASAEDASTVWSNPAGMSLIKTNQVAAAVNLITPSMKFSNGNSVAATNQPLGGNGGDAGSLNVVPNLYLTVPVARDWTFGLGINVPFGLVTEYEGGWIGRYQALKSDVQTMNINPAIAWQVSPSLSIGAGVSYQQIKGTFTSNVNYSGALLRAAATAGIAPGTPTFNAIAGSTGGLDSFASITGDDWSWGWNVGALWQINPSNRIGIADRSDISYSLSGNAEFSNPALPTTIPAALLPTVSALAAGVNTKALYNSGVSSDIKVPGIFNISYFGALNDKWDLMADAQWTHWSTIQYLTFNRTDGSTVPLSSTPEFFKDTWRFAIGANYKLDESWKLRMGLAYDQSPVQEADRTPRLPDSDRTWLSGGVQYKWGKDWKFDLGATYIWVSNGNINNGGNDPATNLPSPASYGLVNGSYSNNVVIVSGQATWSF